MCYPSHFILQTLLFQITTCFDTCWIIFLTSTSTHLKKSKIVSNHRQPQKTSHSFTEESIFYFWENGVTNDGQYLNNMYLSLYFVINVHCHKKNLLKLSIYYPIYTYLMIHYAVCIHLVSVRNNPILPIFDFNWKRNSV